MTGTDQPDRRAAPRIPEQVRVLFRPIEESEGGPGPVEAETVNMSASGLCLVSPRALSAETHLALELGLKDRAEAVVAIGRVVWCDRDGEKFRVGICFTWLREEDRAALKVIADYVQTRLES